MYMYVFRLLGILTWCTWTTMQGYPVGVHEEEINVHRSCCHSNVHLNDDAKSHRSLAHDSKSCRHTWRAKYA